MKIKQHQAEKARALVEWLSCREECTRTEAAAAVGMADDREFRVSVWWPALEVMRTAMRTTFRSLGGGGRYGRADWEKKWKGANRMLGAVRRKFARTTSHLPAIDEVPEEKRPALARAYDRMGHADLVLATKERAKQQIVTTTDYAGLLGFSSSVPR